MKMMVRVGSNPTYLRFIHRRGMIQIIIYDFEVYKHNWTLAWLDTETRKMYFMHDDVELFKRFYEHYKNRIWVGYGSRHFDIWIAKAILSGFKPYDMLDWIINEKQHGFMFSRLLQKFPIFSYDCSVGFRSLKELEAFMGHDIQETSVPFDIDRPLTRQELLEVKRYNIHDVQETFHVFLETKAEFESHIQLIEEFNMPMWMISKTKAQISAEILGAYPKKRNDEFDVEFPKMLKLGKYQYIQDHFENWSENIRSYKGFSLSTEVAGVPTKFGLGGIHSSRDKYYGTGIYVLLDAKSYYPFSMKNHGYLSRNVARPDFYFTMIDDRIAMQKINDPREYPRKIVLNASFGAAKDKYNKLYDPKQANGVCIANQLFLVDLMEKLEDYFEVIQSNTDGVLVKLHSMDEMPKLKSIANEWETRTGFTMSYDYYKTIIQSNVNNYIFIDNDDNLERKGAMVKELSPLDNNLPIVNRAMVNYFAYGIPVRDTIMESDKLIDFQIITKITGKYEYGFHDRKDGRLKIFKREVRDSMDNISYKNEHHIGIQLHEKVHRCFASKDPNDGTVYKKHKDKTTLDKTTNTPDKAFIDNSNILDKPIPRKLDREWYVELADRRVKGFVK